MSEIKDLKKVFWAGAACMAAGLILERGISSISITNFGRGIATIANATRLFKEILTPVVISEGGQPVAQEPMLFPQEREAPGPPPPPAEDPDIFKGNKVYAQTWAQHQRYEELKEKQRQFGTALGADKERGPFQL